MMEKKSLNEKVSLNVAQFLTGNGNEHGVLFRA
jgi:hypothetical protein